MSAIGSQDPSLTSLLASSANRRADGPGGADFAKHMKSKFESAAKAAGVDDADIPGLVDDIQKAIDKAKSEGVSRDGIKDVVAGVLKDHGVSVEKFEAAMKAQRQSGPRPAGF